MTEHTSLYRYSLEEALRWNERDLCRESHKENCSCARAIEEAIKNGYHDNLLDGDIAKVVIERFGYGRVNWASLPPRMTVGKLIASEYEAHAFAYLYN